MRSASPDRPDLHAIVPTRPSGRPGLPATARERLVGRLLAATAALVVASLTLTPGSGPAERLPIACLWCDRFALQDAILNLLLFLPLGVGFGVARARWPIALGAAAALTLAVEAAQLSLVPGRDPSVRDLAVNLLGGAAGFALGLRWRALVVPHRRVAWRLAGGARLAWVALHLLTAWLLVPALPAKPRWVIAGTHVGGFPDFAGRVLHSAVATRPTSPWPGNRADRPLAGAELVLEPGPRTSELTPILTIVEQVGVFSFLLGEEGDDIVLRMRSRAEVAGLRSPGYRLEDAVRPWYRTMPRPTNILQLTVLRTSERTAATVRTVTGGLLSTEVPVRTTHGWAMLWPDWHEFGADPDLPSALWCFALLLPLGYWTALTGRYRWRMGWGLALVAGGSGFIMGPVFFAQAPPGWAEVAGAAAGLAAGAGLALLQLRSKTRRTRSAAG